MELARNLKVESVGRLMPSPLVCLPPSTSVTRAVELMRAQRVGCVLITDPEGRLIGIFTERDLLRRVLAAGESLDQSLALFMTSSPQTARRGEPIGRAVRRMQQGGYRHLPVVEESMKPVGVLSSRGVVHYLVEHFPSTIYCLPPDPDVVPLQREGA